MTVNVKSPSAVLDYSFDWSDWLAGDTITSSSWTTPPGLTLEDASHTDTVTIAWISGGAEGTDYTIANHIVTAGGREDTRSRIIAVKEI